MVYMCPRCGSTDYKFPNPLKASESMINFPGMVKNLQECKVCGYIGVFFEVDEDKVDEVIKKFEKK